MEGLGVAMADEAKEMSGDKEREFLSCLAEILEEDSISPGDDYRETPMWGSLTAFALKLDMQRRYGADLSLAELGEFASAGDLMRRVLA